MEDLAVKTVERSSRVVVHCDEQITLVEELELFGCYKLCNSKFGDLFRFKIVNMNNIEEDWIEIQLLMCSNHVVLLHLELSDCGVLADKNGWWHATNYIVPCLDD